MKVIQQIWEKIQSASDCLFCQAQAFLPEALSPQKHRVTFKDNAGVV